MFSEQFIDFVKQHRTFPSLYQFSQNQLYLLADIASERIIIHPLLQFFQHFHISLVILRRIVAFRSLFGFGQQRQEDVALYLALRNQFAWMRNVFQPTFNLLNVIHAQQHLVYNAFQVCERLADLTFHSVIAGECLFQDGYLVNRGLVIPVH